MTKEDHETPSSAELTEEDPDDPYEERGVKQGLLTKLGKILDSKTLTACAVHRIDSSQWGDQLELSLSRWDGQWSLWD